MTEPLYTAEILRLAASIPFDQRLDRPMASVERRSPVCGSRVAIDLDLDDMGRVAAAGIQVRACALGQASAALLWAHVAGRTPGELIEARDALAAWLSGDRAEPPAWPGVDALAPALPHRGRHAAMLLAFEAAAEAAERACAGQGAPAHG